MSEIYKIKVLDKKGNEVSLEKYSGKVLLIVNTATGCGFTPHYKPLEAMYEKLNSKGFEILDFPCNQFAGQTPGTDEEITEFCTLNYNTKFPQFKKIDVNGPTATELFKYLKSKKGFQGFEGEKADLMNGLLAKIDPDYKNNSEIKWNFTKFLINKKGQVVARFEPTEKLENVEAKIKEELAK